MFVAATNERVDLAFRVRQRVERTPADGASLSRWEKKQLPQLSVSVGPHSSSMT
jgi:hypothetical protein